MTIEMILTGIIIALMLLLAAAGFVIYRLTILLAERPIVQQGRGGTQIVRPSTKEPEYAENLPDKKKNTNIPLAEVDPVKLMEAIDKKAKEAR